MRLFEYHLTVSKSLREEANRAASLAELERKQLRIVLANVAHVMKTQLMAFQMGIRTLTQLVSQYLGDYEYRSRFEVGYGRDEKCADKGKNYD
jgi:hypothetical protein